MGTLGEAMERARMYGPKPARQATGIFSDVTRQILAEEAVKHAYRLNHPHIGTGHVLLATLDSRDRTVARIVGTGVMGSGPVTDRIGREVVRVLPGNEHPSGRVDHGVIRIDVLTRLLAAEFSKLIPVGWRARAQARIGAIGLTVPGSQSEEDYRVNLDWIVTRDRAAPTRLVEVTRASLDSLQQSMVTHTGAPWPPNATPGPGSLVEPHAEITGGENPILRLWYGTSESPDLELFQSHRPPTNMVLDTY
jgi:hypothetical protein